jgi:hypothetical protein
VKKTIQQFNNSTISAGISLVEVVIGSSLILLALTGLITAYAFYFRGGLGNTPELQASFLLQEGAEAMTLLREEAWSNLSSLSPETPYFLLWNGTKWTTVTAETLIDNAFRRTVTVFDVYRRNSDKDIVPSASPDAKAIDPNTKQITVRVTAPSIDRTLATYLTNLFE